MALSRYQSNNPDAAIAQIEFYNNSFGREDAIIYANETAEPGQLNDLAFRLKQNGITAYPDIRDGKQVMVAYGFKKSENLINTLNGEGLATNLQKVQTELTDSEKEENKSYLKKFIRRYAIRLAAVSGLLGHASMGTISALTGDKKFFGTAWKYTLADAVISLYGTDKSVTADPVMQSFKDYLWKQGVDNSFVKARTDKVGALEGFDNFMKKRSFQIANAFGGMGNLNQIQIGIEDKNTGFLVAGVTSLFGAGLQIFGSEQKRNPEQLKRQGPLSRLFAFIDTNPMQIAAATNFTDPFALFYSAYNNKKIEAKNKASNDAELKKHYAILGNSNLQTRDLFARGNDSLTTSSANFAAASQAAEALNAEYKKKTNFFKRFTDPFSKEKADQLEANFKTEYAKLQGENGLGEDGLPEDKFAEKFKSEDAQKAAKSISRIKDLQADNAKIAKGGKWKTILLYMVATFYTGATLLRFVAKKTASEKENKDAFNEVYAAAAESLLHIQDPDKREMMLLQMGHYLSTHEKMKESSEVIISKLRERVDSFAQSPFVEAPAHIAQAATIEPVSPLAEAVAARQAQAEKETEKADKASDIEAKPAAAANWSEKSGSKEFASHQDVVETARSQAETAPQQPSL